MGYTKNKVVTKEKTTIVIIGGGIAGCIAAIAASSLYHVVLIDKQAEPQQRIGECLPAVASRIFKKLGLLDSFIAQHGIAEEDKHLPHLGTVSFWGSSKPAFADPLRNPDGFGWHINRKAFELFLRAEAEKRGVQCIWPAKLHSATQHHNDWEVNLRTENSKELLVLQSKFIIDATGRNAQFAKKQGAIKHQTDSLIACWATVPNTTKQVSSITSCEFGWWYTAPVPGNKQIIAFHTDADMVTHTTTTNRDLFIQLGMHIPQVKTLITPHQRALIYMGTVAANSTHLNRAAGNGWAAIGDAALSFDPLSSQGMYNGMATALQLIALLQHNDGVYNTSGTSWQTAYTKQIEAIKQQYYFHKNTYYSQEHRWNKAPFWRRRQVSNVVV